MTVLGKIAPFAFVAASALVALPAVADTQRQLTVDISYDADALETSEGAAIVLNSLNIQANRACLFDQPITGAPRVDKDCADEAVALAVSKIDHANLTRAYADATPQSVQILADAN